MSKHRFTVRKRRQRCSPSFSLLGGLLLALMLTMVSAVRASASSSGAIIDKAPEEKVARAGVSLVRVLTTYTVSGNKVQCTGLGIVVKSVASTGGSMQNWVLTDGSLVDTGSNKCNATPLPSGTLQFSTVQVIHSTYYNKVAPPITVEKKDIRCLETDCASGAALLGFTSNTFLPAVPFPQNTSAANTGSAAIGLSRQETTTDAPPTLPVGDSQELVKQFLTPALIGDVSKAEVGTPLVDSAGNLLDLHLKGSVKYAQQKVLDTLAEVAPGSAANDLQTNWTEGLNLFYEQNKQFDANPLFKKVATANPQFEGANDFVRLSTPPKTTDGGKTPGDGGTSTTEGAQTGGLTIPILNMFVPYWLLSGIGLVVLLLIVLVVSLISRQKRKQRVDREYAEAERRAAIEAPLIKEKESQPVSWEQPTVVQAPAAVPAPAYAPQGAVPVNSGNTSPRMSAVPASALRCPRCNQPVPAGANYCSNCRLMLSPSESGLHLKVTPQQLAQTPPMAPPAPPAPSLMDQPTVDMSKADQPTVDMREASQIAASGMEKTVPYKKARRLSSTAIARTNPGIKRKFKPNEDSLFAGKGVRAVQPQLAGLYVVADGMGGHANGQNASRLAIQTIINYILPRLMQSAEEMDFKQLLVEGIQNANMAVHQQNLEQHADMGTTITAALIVEDMGYVANVGDSRTYLYRENVGLSKVTNDHSVVASLVEAGIIKPDDIYTHPKRNQIYRSLGEKPAVEVDAFDVPLLPGDKLMLCSDGMWDMVRDPRIEEVFKQNANSLDATGDAMIQAALDGGGEDNVSVVLVQIAEATRRPSKPGFQMIAKPDTVQMPRLG